MRLLRPCFLSSFLFPGAVFRLKTREKQICLTFDDGPHPETTPEILQILKRHNIKAVFFCRGDTAERYPGLVQEIISEGHLTGNHGYSHLDGWKTPAGKYTDDVERASLFVPSVLFRPPYGRLTLKQDKTLVKKYKIVFWDLMPYDFDTKFGAGNSLRILKTKIRPGSVIVLHDSPRSSVISFLGEFIEFAFNQGYSFVLPDEIPGNKPGLKNK
ncbi:MAG: polysaccharide deacetylase family protein [Bacteroidales bacterium]|nr:polysaccharide deacetylase family protein [Bacteroidales bacterium]